MIERLTVGLCNWLLRTFAPRSAKFNSGAIEYGMRAAAEDARLGKPLPPDWRAPEKTRPGP